MPAALGKEEVKIAQASADELDFAIQATEEMKVSIVLPSEDINDAIQTEPVAEATGEEVNVAMQNETRP